MSKATATRNPARARPLSPHLSVYRLTPTMLMSGMHRVTGAALFFGSLLVAWWLIAAATSQEYFDWVSWFWGTWFGRLVLFGYTWALMHHMLGGLRHFVWDVGEGLEKHTATRLANLNLAGSIVLTLAIWIVGYMVRGG